MSADTDFKKNFFKLMVGSLKCNSFYVYIFLKKVQLVVTTCYYNYFSMDVFVSSKTLILLRLMPSLGRRASPCGRGGRLSS